MKPRAKAKFRVGQRVVIRGSGEVVKIKHVFHSESGYPYYWFEPFRCVRYGKSLRPLTRRERGGATMKRKKAKRCRRIGPLSGLRCILPAGHKGEHKNDPVAAERLANAYMSLMFPSRRERGEPGRKRGRA